MENSQQQPKPTFVGGQLRWAVLPCGHWVAAEQDLHLGVCADCLESKQAVDLHDRLADAEAGRRPQDASELRC